MMGSHLAAAVQSFAVWAIPLVLSITLHEAAHGLAAWRLGDDTALRMGRVSANPLTHVDPFGTLLLPGILLLTGSSFLIGWAKPVPVNFGRLKPIRLGTILVALAGPGANIALAVISALLLHAVRFLPGIGQVWAAENLVNSVQINLVLAVFNMLPVPPLDGGRVVLGFLPPRVAMRFAGMERFTMIGLVIVLLVLPAIGVNVFGWLVGLPAFYLQHMLFTATGLT